MGKKRVVITGMGTINVFGNTLEDYWEGLLAGRSGIGMITRFDASDLPCQIAGEVNDFKPEDYFSRKDIRRMPRCGQLAVAATVNAVKDASLPETMPEPERAGVVYGTAIGGIDKIVEGITKLRADTYRKVNPFILPVGLPNFPAFMIAKQFHCYGPNTTITTACATSTQAIGEASEWIRRGKTDIMITGGTDAFITDYGIGGFCAMRALPVNFNHAPEEASRPFDKDREGFVFSEGAGTMVLESLEHAQIRGARIYAEIGGHASSNDAYHMAAPDPNVAGPKRAMRWALEDGGISSSEVDYINAHGTSTPLNDASETRAIKELFGDHAYHLVISSTKSMLGHAMGASGVLEAIVCALAITHNRIPPTINYTTPDPDCDLDYTPNQWRDTDVDVTLSNSFGLGGQNACLVLKKFVP
jgi:beta-ketoacyl-acyl-carrier-protein synthase II